jgi:Zn-dependent peptidase ImmA (M78 family)
VSSLNTNRGAKRAREARERYGLDDREPVPCILRLVERDAGIPVIVRWWPADAAGSYWHHGDRRLIQVNGMHAVVRRRFTLAHELGHFCCGHDGRMKVDSVKTLSGKTTDDNEIQANAFAASFLAPRRGVVERIDKEPDLETVVRLAAEFGISAIAALYRLVTLELISAKRKKRIEDEIDEGMHEELYKHLDLDVNDDGLARIETLPYLSPALDGTALAATLRGDNSIDQAADAAGVDPATFAPAIEGLAAG